MGERKHKKGLIIGIKTWGKAKALAAKSYKIDKIKCILDYFEFFIAIMYL